MSSPLWQLWRRVEEGIDSLVDPPIVTVLSTSTSVLLYVSERIVARAGPPYPVASLPEVQTMRFHRAVAVIAATAAMACADGSGPTGPAVSPSLGVGTSPDIIRGRTSSAVIRANEACPGEIQAVSAEISEIGCRSTPR
jgi:hypothetical protein